MLKVFYKKDYIEYLMLKNHNYHNLMIEKVHYFFNVIIKKKLARVVRLSLASRRR